MYTFATPMTCLIVKTFKKLNYEQVTANYIIQECE
jgi:hypothetical protein